MTRGQRFSRKFGAARELRGRGVTLLQLLIAIVACDALAACSTTNPAKMDVAETSAHVALLPAGTLTGAQITQALSDRKFVVVQEGVKGYAAFRGDGTL